MSFNASVNATFKAPARCKYLSRQRVTQRLRLQPPRAHPEGKSESPSSPSSDGSQRAEHVVETSLDLFRQIKSVIEEGVSLVAENKERAEATRVERLRHIWSALQDIASEEVRVLKDIKEFHESGRPCAGLRPYEDQGQEGRGGMMETIRDDDATGLAPRDLDEDIFVDKLL